MSTRKVNGISEKTRSDKINHQMVTQEIIVKKDGSIELQWITPKASALVMALWKDLNDNEDFPVMVISGEIYCG